MRYAHVPNKLLPTAQANVPNKAKHKFCNMGVNGVGWGGGDSSPGKIVVARVKPPWPAHPPTAQGNWGGTRQPATVSNLRGGLGRVDEVPHARITEGVGWRIELGEDKNRDRWM